MKLAFFPGCSAKSSGFEYANSALKLMKELGLKIVTPDFNCCGTHIVEEYNRDVWLALNARNLAIAEEIEADIVTICPACYQNLKKAKIILENEEEKKKINGILASIDKEYTGKTSVFHVIELLKKFTDKLKIKNKSKKVVAYYGCQILRPPELGIDNPENPKIFENFLKEVGFKVEEFKAKSDCCGGTFLLTNPDGFKRRAESILNEAKKVADCIVTLCPLCQFSLEIVSSDIEVVPFTSLILNERKL